MDALTRYRTNTVPSVHNISEEIAMHSLDQVDETCRKRSPPITPSLHVRSHSDFVGCGLTNNLMDLYMKSVNPLLPQSGSTDLTLAKFESLPKMYRRSNRYIGRLNTQLLEAVECGNVLEVKRLLEAGASPNATCHVDFVSACHIAALSGDGALSLLLKHGAEKHRTDRMGRTPLHVAAWAGHVQHLGLFLELPEAIQKKIDHGEVTPEVEKEVRKLRVDPEDIVNTHCTLGEMSINVPKEWRDSVEHNCHNIAERITDACSGTWWERHLNVVALIQLPFFQPGWTPLHAASSSARHHCVRLLLAAGAEPCLRDVTSRTPLEVAGSAYYTHTGNKQQALPSLHPLGFAEVVAMLLATDCRSSNISKRINLHTPLHTAVELESLDSITQLLEAGACAVNLNRDGETPLHVCIKKRLKPHLQAFIYFDFQHPQSPSSLIVDVKDKDGYTVLHSCVLNNWLPGVCLALEAGANIISMSLYGETPLHSAAELEQMDILKEILAIAKDTKVIDKTNKRGETALFKAVTKGNIDCAKMLLKQGASIETTLPDRRNVLHIAAARGLYHMLKFLLDYNYTVTRKSVNDVTVDDRKGYGPIHFAAERGHLDCIKLLLSRNAYINLKATSSIHKGQTPLHIAARKNNTEIVKLILKNNNESIYMEDALGWNALHTACYYASRDVIKLLLREGSDISAYTGGESKLRKTAIQLIMNNVSKPTEFMLDIFDSCISCDYACSEDPNCEVTVDYGILLPNKHDIDSDKVDDVGILVSHKDINNMEMKVIQTLLKTGNTYDQKRLLIHPLVESFLCLKWKALVPFFYIMLVLYGLFVMTLTSFILSVYYYRDSQNRTDLNSKGPTHAYPYNKDLDRPEWLDCSAWVYVLYFTISLIVLQELLYMKVSRRYFLQLETWVKFSSIALALFLPPAIYSTKKDWPRHFATIALLLSWLQMTFLLSRFPNWGYYILIFRKVSTKVLKILMTFVILVIGFALSFMIEYHSKIPFENPWAAFVKTMVMMTSEFDYDDLVKKKDSANLKISLIIIRLLFLIFMILASIVLMNLMVAVAVHDLNDLEVQGNIMRLEKQVEFLASLETLVNVKTFMKILPKKLKYKLKFVRSLTKISLKPCEPSWSYSKAIPAHVRDAIIDKGQYQKEKNDDQVDCNNIQKKLDHIFAAIGADRKPGNGWASKHDIDDVKKQIDSVNNKLDKVLHYLLDIGETE